MQTLNLIVTICVILLFAATSWAEAAPVANFTTNPGRGPAPLTIYFTDTSTGSPTSWSWDFGDGNSSSNQNPSHKYYNSGAYTIILTVTNDSGSNSKTGNITVTGAANSPWSGRVTVCVDDCDYTSMTVIPSLFQSYGLVGTAFPIAGWIGNGWECTWDQLQTLVQNGWEIGNHTMTHPDLTTLSATDLDYQIGQAKQILEQNLGVNVTTLATPYGTGTDNKLTMQYVSKYCQLARTVYNAPNYFPFAPYNMFAWAVEYNAPPATVIQSIQDAMANGYWLVLTFHQVGSSGAQDVYPTDNLAQILQYLQANSIAVVTLAQGMAFNRGPNLVQNSDFNSTDSTGWATNWTRIGSAADVSLQTVSPFPRVFTPGPQWLTLQSADSGTTMGTTSDPIHLTDTTVPYFLSFFIDSTILTGSVSIIAQELGSTGQLINSQQLGSLGASYNASWSAGQVEMTGYVYQPSSSNVKAVQISVQANFTGAANLDHFFFGSLPAKGAPAASFTNNPTSGPAPLAVEFTDTSTGDPTSWSWEFGDGSTSTAQNPSHIYKNTGTFTAKLTVSNAEGSSSQTITITVRPGVNLGPLWLLLQSTDTGTTIGTTSNPIPFSNTTVPYLLSFSIDSTIQTGSISFIAQEFNSTGQLIYSQQLGSLGTDYNACWLVARWRCRDMCIRRPAVT
jgi:large repetitive protein